MLKQILIIVSLVFFGASTSSAKPKLQPSYVSVTGFDYTIGGKESVSISIGKSQEDYFDVTIHRDQIKEYSTIERSWTQKTNMETEWKTKVIDANAIINGQKYRYSLFKGLRSVIILKIKELNYKTKEAVIDVYLKLVDVSTHKFITLDKQGIKIKGKQFHNLVKK